MIYTQFIPSFPWNSLTICVCFHGEMEIRFGLLSWSSHGQVSLWLFCSSDWSRRVAMVPNYGFIYHFGTVRICILPNFDDLIHISIQTDQIMFNQFMHICPICFWDGFPISNPPDQSIQDSERSLFGAQRENVGIDFDKQIPQMGKLSIFFRWSTPMMSTRMGFTVGNM